MSHLRAMRIGLGYLALSSAYVAVWILLAPRGFYDTFPTGPAEWVSPLPPFNEHLLRDFGAAGLGLAVLAVLAAVWLERRLVQATAIAFLVSALPHFVYHLTTTDRLSTARQPPEPRRAAAARRWCRSGCCGLSRSAPRAGGPSPPPAASSAAPR